MSNHVHRSCLGAQKWSQLPDARLPPKCLRFRLDARLQAPSSERPLNYQHSISLSFVEAISLLLHTPPVASLHLSASLSYTIVSIATFQGPSSSSLPDVGSISRSSKRPALQRLAAAWCLPRFQPNSQFPRSCQNLAHFSIAFKILLLPD